MAKCLKEPGTGKISRFSEKNRAEQDKILGLVKQGWQYVAKSEWKATRPKPKKEEKEEVSSEKQTKRGKKSNKQ
jgi:hypothetical protein